MERQGDEVHIDTDEARGGQTPHIVRWVLAISMLLAVIVMSLVWIIPALNQGDVEEEITASGIEQSQDSGSGTDSIVSDGFDELDETGTGADSGGSDTIEN